MRDKLLKLKSTANKIIAEDIWWKYNWALDDESQLSDDVVAKLTESLDSFIDTLYRNYPVFTEEMLSNHIRKQIDTMVAIYPPLLDDCAGFYDYGGLNDFFLQVFMCFPFCKETKYKNNVEAIYDFINGLPFDKLV